MEPEVPVHRAPVLVGVPLLPVVACGELLGGGVSSPTVGVDDDLVRCVRVKLSAHVVEILNEGTKVPKIFDMRKTFLIYFQKIMSFRYNYLKNSDYIPA